MTKVTFVLRSPKERCYGNQSAYVHELAGRSTAMHKVKVEGHSVQKLEWKKTHGQTDGGRRRLHYLPC